MEPLSFFENPTLILALAIPIPIISGRNTMMTNVNFQEAMVATRTADIITASDSRIWPIFVPVA